jgi:hypothetical protein
VSFRLAFAQIIKYDRTKFDRLHFLPWADTGARPPGYRLSWYGNEAWA